MTVYRHTDKSYILVHEGIYIIEHNIPDLVMWILDVVEQCCVVSCLESTSTSAQVHITKSTAVTIN